MKLKLREELVESNSSEHMRFRVWLIKAGTKIKTAYLSDIEYLEKIADQKEITDAIKETSDYSGAVQFGKSIGGQVGEVLIFFPISSKGIMETGMFFKPQILVLS